MRHVIIIGSGPAGFTGAIFAAAQPRTARGRELVEVGGELMNTTEVEN